MTLRVVVAGAGALGSSIAVALARAGAVVTLADPAHLGDNASGVAAGMLAPAFESVFDRRPKQFELLARARDVWPTFAASLGIEIERPGALAVSFDEAEIAGWRATLDGLGVASAQLTTAEVEQRRPDLAPGLFGLALDDDWRLDPALAMRALGLACQTLGVEFRSAAVTDFVPGRADFSDGSTAAADALVIATGASPSLTGLAPELDCLRPIKGHILNLAVEAGGAEVVRFSGGYLCPDAHGVLLGATMEEGRGDTAIDPDQVDRLRDLGSRYAPALGRMTARARVGVRAATPDGAPLLGPSRTPGVWLAAGARRNGWLLAPMVARTVAEGLAAAHPGAGGGLRADRLRGKSRP